MKINEQQKTEFYEKELNKLKKKKNRKFYPWSMI